MTRAERINAKVLEFEALANDQVKAIEYRMARPPNHAKDPGGYHAHQAEIPGWKAEIVAIEDALHHVVECLMAELFHERAPTAPSGRAAEIIERFRRLQA